MRRSTPPSPASSRYLRILPLLQEDASVQKMVMALSTDKAVWDAVMNNEVVQEFKKSFQDAKETDTKGSSSALLNDAMGPGEHPGED
ncbi:hypothetical protein ZWY2020_013628 [Hordeum vulgare]|nr:hypothetical protein ZWY2020_013628 [Hordeum vulgare]